MEATARAGRTVGRATLRGRVVGAGAGALMALLVLGGCAGMDGAPGQGTEEPDEGEEALGGFGLPVVPEGGVPGESVPLLGTLAVEDNGCFTFATADGVHHWVIWPRGSQDDGAQVVLPDGTTVGEGQALEGTGTMLPIDEAVPEFANPDSYFGSFGRFCEAEAADVVVLEDVAVPTAG